MGFKPISLEKYINKHIENNPTQNENELRKNLNTAIQSHQNGERCSCGNDIWVIGSAFVGNTCFTCITGESYPDDDFEIDIAIKKRDSIVGRRHIDDVDPTQIAGFFDDDGYEINNDLIEKPTLCLTCTKDDDPSEEFLCQMNRYDQRD
nr:hypothetical protein [Bacteroidota bacterium]